MSQMSDAEYLWEAFKGVGLAFVALTVMGATLGQFQSTQHTITGHPKPANQAVVSSFTPTGSKINNALATSLFDKRYACRDVVCYQSV